MKKKRQQKKEIEKVGFREMEGSERKKGRKKGRK